MKITVSAHTHLATYTRTPAFARVFYQTDFVNGDGESVSAGELNGEYTKQVSVSYASGVSIIAAFSGSNRLDSTLVSTTGQILSYCTLALYDANGKYIDIVFENIKIPDTPTTTWAELANIALMRTIPFRAEYPSREQVQVMIDEAVGVLPDELSELGDVALTSPVTGDVLTYNGTDWVNEQPEPTGLGSLFFDATKLQNINHGVFWRPAIDYSHFFWEGWFKPYYNGTNQWTGYGVSDNQGGDHNLLWGCAMGAGSYSITGNIHNGTSLFSFATAETYPANEWAHWAVGWDGSHIMLWVNGILCRAIAYSAGRKQPGGNNFTLHIAGSDHNNYWGNIAVIRAYEGYGRCAQNVDFSPELYFRPLSANSSAIRDTCQFFASYQTKQAVYADLSAGFEGVLHSGVPEAPLSALGVGEASPPFNDYALPEFQAGDIEVATVTPTAPTMPVGAKVWDSFSRLDVTALNSRLLVPQPANIPLGIPADPTMGSTEGGSLGALLWTSDSVSFPTATAAILAGRCVMPYNNTSQLLQTGLQTVDIRVDRLPFAECYASIFFRYKDGNDYYAVWGNDAGLNLRKREGGLTTDVPITTGTGWVTLRVVANGTTCTIYTGTATEGVFTSVATPTITNVAGATKHGLYNSQTNIKTVYRADNFCIL